MTRLTEKENLSNNLKKLRKLTGYSAAYISEQSGISQRAYENYLYCEKGASTRNLEKLAAFYKTTADILVASDMNLEEIKMQKIIREYKLIWDEKTTTLFDKISGVLEAKCGKNFTAFIDLIKQLDFNVTYLPSFNSKEISIYRETKYNAQYENKIGGLRNEKCFENLVAKSKHPQPLNQELRKTLLKFYEVTKSSYVDSRLTCELFLEKYENGDFDNVKPEDLPLEIRFEQNRDFKTITEIDSIKVPEDITSYYTEHTVSEIMELLETVQDNILDFIYSEG